MTNKTERIHSLDSLRAVMMILGLVLHSAQSYMVSSSFWPKDIKSTSYFIDYIENLIHMFRMPIFFVMAGFFGALLYYERGATKMIRNRVNRIVFPFIVFLVLLAPTILISFSYSQMVFSGKESAFSTAVSTFNINTLLQDSTYHLWFLYYLIVITFVSFILAKILHNTKVASKIKNAFEWILNGWIRRVFIFSLLVFALLLINWELKGPTPLSFAIDYKAFLFYFFFYIVGWLLFLSKNLLESFLKYNRLLVFLGLLLFTATFLMYNQIDDVIKGIISSFVIVLLVFGITGLFIRYFSSNSKRMRYMSDASYWLYLIHLPITIIIPAMIASWELPGEIKFLITLSITTVICYVSYKYLVRNSFIGKFLNGKKYPL